MINHNPLSNYGTNLCPYIKQSREGDLPEKQAWDDEHPRAAGSGWYALIPDITSGPKDCEADEWPPYALAQEADGYDMHPDVPPRVITKPQFIRLLDGNQNGRIGAKFRRCPYRAEVETVSSNVHSRVGADKTTTSTTDYKVRITRTTYVVDPVIADPDGDDGLQVNECYPRGSGNNDYRGFALLNNDGWYSRNPAAKAFTDGYKRQPPSNARARSEWVDPERVAVVDANSSRRATDEELRDDFGLLRCGSEGCDVELREYADQGAVPYGPGLSSLSDTPASAPVSTWTTMAAGQRETIVDPPTPQKGVGTAESAQQTEASSPDC